MTPNTHQEWLGKDYVNWPENTQTVLILYGEPVSVVNRDGIVEMATAGGTRWRVPAVRPSSTPWMWEQVH